jgi:two-component system, cell cycle sensor histidine kinase and response regulator CckA
MAAVKSDTRQTILVVEDENIVRMVVTRALSKCGYHILEASDAPKALKVAEEFAGRIDLLLTDIVMPGGMSGCELAEKLSQSRPEMSLLYMSGYPYETIASKGLLPNGVRFLEKSFSANVLCERVRETLAGGPAKVQEEIHWI